MNRTAIIKNNYDSGAFGMLSIGMKKGYFEKFERLITIIFLNLWFKIAGTH
ncbi:hypothetical protein FM107_06705 [Sphingobacterium sp. JB170]|nr:hypothetical protein FM107_06705 [Sphingobacterium sp. JB170]